MLPTRQPRSPLSRILWRRETLGNFLTHPSNCLIEGLDLREMFSQHEPMMGRDFALPMTSELPQFQVSIFPRLLETIDLAGVFIFESRL